jgi:hypothetical protein
MSSSYSRKFTHFKVTNGRGRRFAVTAARRPELAIAFMGIGFNLHRLREHPSQLCPRLALRSVIPLGGAVGGTLAPFMEN